MQPVEMLAKLNASSLYFLVYGNAGKDEPSKIIGQAKVDIRKNFIDSVHYASTTSDFPTTANLATSCKIENVFKDITGKIEVYIRLSCFGKFIISMFNMLNGDRNPKDKKKVEQNKTPSECQI